jgi:hypothetical protein
MEVQWMKMDRFDVRASNTSLSIEFRAGIDQMRMFEHDTSSIDHDSMRGAFQAPALPSDRSQLTDCTDEGTG